MRKVVRTEPGTDAWTRWCADAQDAAEALAKEFSSGARPAIKQGIYKGAKPFLLQLFAGKCAYCEGMIELMHAGDVEHYRPKAAVRDLDGKCVMVDADGREEEHPGYWWLAYDWKNLLPSCNDCNRRRRQGAKLAGKGEVFPVRAFRASRPGDEVHEEPLLVNPSEPWGDPEVHFIFEDNGYVKPKTEEGAATCALLGFNDREPLVEARREKAEDVKNLVRTLIVAYASDNDKEARRIAVRINAIWEGAGAYSAAARAELLRQQAGLAKKGLQLSLPVLLAEAA